MCSQIACWSLRTVTTACHSLIFCHNPGDKTKLMLLSTNYLKASLTLLNWGGVRDIKFIMFIMHCRNYISLHDQGVCTSTKQGPEMLRQKNERVMTHTCGTGAPRRWCTTEEADTAQSLLTHKLDTAFLH
jgi:hypothetical protein